MKTKFLVLSLLTLLALVISACGAAGVPAAPAATGGEAAAAPSGAEEYTTPHPILSDVKVRQALAYCIDRDALIASVYPSLADEEKQALRMDAFLPTSHWAWSGPYDFPDYDPERGKALLEEAGWTQVEGAPARTNANGDQLSLKFTTTNSQFRQTWSAVMIQNLAECGIQVIPTYAPPSWWFGETTGLARRDYELGGFAWVGQPDPGGREIYACDQIPLPSNNWTGQNTLGWCNQKASDAIVKATNTLLKDDRKISYDIFKKEFAADVPSIPLFQRAEADAWTTNLEGARPDPTEYFTQNMSEWKLKDGGDTIVVGMTQEPDSMWGLVSSMAARELIGKPMGVTSKLYLQYNYDFQPFPGLQDKLATIENGLAKNNDVEVKTGDTVYSKSGNPVTLDTGVVVYDNEGNEVTYDGTSPLTMKQLVVDYEFLPVTWSDGIPVSLEDLKLGQKIDCDRESGAINFITCDTVQDIRWADDGTLAYTVTYLPGVQTPTYYLPPFSIYPSHHVLSDGRVLAEVPAAEWATLPEIAERPLSWGPYMVKEWNKGQNLILEKNPYWAGEVATPNIIFVFIPDTNQAMAQLMNGDVDVLEKSTLGAAFEPLLPSVESGALELEVTASPTWEHVDINFNTK